jgi:hypothetical protein
MVPFQIILVAKADFTSGLVDTFDGLINFANFLS